MKFFAALIAFAAVVCVVLADKMDKKEGLVASSYGGGAAPSYGGGHAPASYSAPPCPKNYLFSCQPSVAPVPCAPGGGHGGYAGAYSHQIPQYLPYPQYAPQN